MVLSPFSSKKKQRIWAGVSSLGGLLIAAVGTASQPSLTFLGLNLITIIGAIAFIIALVYLIDVAS